MKGTYEAAPKQQRAHLHSQRGLAGNHLPHAPRHALQRRHAPMQGLHMKLSQEESYILSLNHLPSSTSSLADFIYA